MITLLWLLLGEHSLAKLEQLMNLQMITDDGFLERFLPCFPVEPPAQYNAKEQNLKYEKAYVEYMNKIMYLNKAGRTKSVFLDPAAKKYLMLI